MKKAVSLAIAFLLFFALSASAVEPIPAPPFSVEVPAEGYAQVMFDQGYNLYQAGRKEEAIQFFIEAVTTKPDFTKAWTWLARTYQEENMLNEAIWAWRKVLELEPGNSQAKYFLEKCENWKKYGKEPWEAYEQGYLFYEQQDYFQAIEYFNKAISQNPQMDKAYYWLGIANLEVGDYHQAEWALEKYLSFHPDDANVQYWLRVAKSRAN
ncbi:MAG: hypothetical protein PWP04_975 [Candidatus Atribacteria bacterium]|nr:hypothetical protein [Candidatus Atribacteria bacterium]